MNNEQLKKYMVLLVTGAIIIQRLSMALGNLCLGLAVLIFFILLQRERTLLTVNKELAGYYRAFAFFMLCLLPSILFTTGSVVGSAKVFVGMWLYRAMPFIILTLFVRKNEAVPKLLTWWAAGLCLDAIVCVSQYGLQLAPRGWGFGGNTLTLPGILCMLMPMLLIVILDENFVQKQKNISKVMFGICFMGVLAGFSRGAWLDLLILLPLVALPYVLKSPKKLFGFVLALVLVLGLFSTQPTLVAKVKSMGNFTTNTSNLGRVWVWQSTVHMIADHPLVGVGPGEWRRAYREQYRLPVEKQDLVHSHNSYLQVFAENGLIGLIGCVSFFAYLLYNNGKMWLQTKNPYALMLLASCTGMLLNGITDNNFDNSALIKTFWFLLGCLLLLRNQHQVVCKD